MEQSKLQQARPRFPEWLKFKAPGSPTYIRVKNILASHQLNTICQSALCPNIGECYSRGTATFMIMGPNCTRHCKYCNVISGKPEPLDEEEPVRLAGVVAALHLRHAVVTSVTRDDVEDAGASMFVKTIQEIRRQSPGTTIEILTPEFNGDDTLLRMVVGAQPDIFNHNIETVRRLFPRVRPKSDYEGSLRFLRRIREMAPSMLTKSGLIAGMGETDEEVVQVLKDLRDQDVDLVTIGQYLRPSHRHLAVHRFIPPATFAEWKRTGLELGFRAVESAPHVRSSYHAEEVIHADAGPIYEATG